MSTANQSCNSNVDLNENCIHDGTLNLALWRMETNHIQLYLLNIMRRCCMPTSELEFWEEYRERPRGYFITK